MKKYRIIIVLEEVDVPSGEADELVDFTMLLADDLPNMDVATRNLDRLSDYLNFFEIEK